jgi:methylmalonyl-CoA/ethylmalonyl-CoA epimerase
MRQERSSQETSMPLALGPIGQIARPVADVDRAEAFYGEVLRLRKLFRFGDLSFFDCAGVRLLLEKTNDTADLGRAGVIYFRVADIALAVKELAARGVVFDDKPHLIARMEDHDLWMTFFKDPDGHILSLMQEAPKGYQPPAPG